jgi:hypothetical protein
VCALLDDAPLLVLAQEQRVTSPGAGILYHIISIRTTSYTNQALLAASHLALDGASALGHAGVAAAGEGENQEGGEGEENGEELHCEELVVGCGG